MKDSPSSAQAPFMSVDNWWVVDAKMFRFPQGVVVGDRKDGWRLRLRLVRQTLPRVGWIFNRDGWRQQYRLRVSVHPWPAAGTIFGGRSPSDRPNSLRIKWQRELYFRWSQKPGERRLLVSGGSTNSKNQVKRPPFCFGRIVQVGRTNLLLFWVGQEIWHCTPTRPFREVLETRRRTSILLWFCQNYFIYGETSPMERHYNIRR